MFACIPFLLNGCDVLKKNSVEYTKIESHIDSKLDNNIICNDTVINVPDKIYNKLSVGDDVALLMEHTADKVLGYSVVIGQNTYGAWVE